MAKRKTQKTLAELEYAKELKRIKQFLRRASNRGFMWDDEIIPKKPKNVTKKSVEKLRKLTPTVLYKKGSYVDQDTGEVLTATAGRHLERKKSAEKAKETRQSKTPKYKNRNKNGGKEEQQTPPHPKQDKPETDYTQEQDDYIYDQDEYYPSFTDVVISNFYATINQFPNAEGTKLLASWIDKLIADNGRGNVAQMLQDGAEAGLIVTWETVYKSTHTKTYMTEMMDYLPDQGKFYSDQIMDMMEQFEWWEAPQ